LYLFDTNVISETAKKGPHGCVLTWIASVPSESLHISAITVAEIHVGIERIGGQDAARADSIGLWLGEIVANTDVLPIGVEVAIVWAKLMSGRSRESPRIDGSQQRRCIIDSLSLQGT
jgi:predicted nucleic acid-binding protein